MARGGKKTGSGAGKWSSEQLAELLQVGAVFSVWTADYDANDLYPLRIDALTDDGGITLSFPDGSRLSRIHCTQAALADGQGPVFLSQMSAIAGPAHSTDWRLETASHSPPFLLSRAALGKLKAGQSVTLDVYTGQFSVTKQGEAVATVRIGDEPISVPVLHAQDDRDSDWSPVDLWVLDHPQWPLLLKLDFGGECELSLFEITPAQ